MTFTTTAQPVSPDVEVTAFRLVGQEDRYGLKVGGTKVILSAAQALQIAHELGFVRNEVPDPKIPSGEFTVEPIAAGEVVISQDGKPVAILSPYTVNAIVRKGPKPEAPSGTFDVEGGEGSITLSRGGETIVTISRSTAEAIAEIVAEDDAITVDDIIVRDGSHGKVWIEQDDDNVLVEQEDIPALISALANRIITEKD
jgi:hypothetical protein